MTERIPIAAARRQFAKILKDAAGGKRIKLTRYNDTLAGLIPKRDLEELEDCAEERGTHARPGRPTPRKKARHA